MYKQSLLLVGNVSVNRRFYFNSYYSNSLIIYKLAIDYLIREKRHHVHQYERFPQDCVLTSTLFNLYSERVMQTSLQDHSEEAKTKFILKKFDKI